jgi:hypothetical protein
LAEAEHLTKTESEYLTEVYAAMQILKRNTKAAKRRKARSQKAKDYWANNPEVRIKQSNSMKRFWSDSENRKKMRLIHQSPEYRRKVSEGLKASYQKRRKLEKEVGSRVE